MHATTRIIAGVAVLLLAGLGLAQAQGTYPNRNVRVIVPFGAGGATARLVAQKLTERLEQQLRSRWPSGARSFAM